MRYMLLLYAAPDAGPNPGIPEQAAEMQKWYDYTQALSESGSLISGEPLHGIETATTVTIDGDKVITTDGPFAETKEVLGGYYMIDVADLDTATGWAAKAPITSYGCVEVRPIMELG